MGSDNGGATGDGGTTGSGGASGGGGENAGGTAGDGGSPGTDGGSGDVAPPPATGGDDKPLPDCKRKVPVADAAALPGALGGAMPGDCIELADGDYPAPTITAKGTEAAPIVVRAQNRLKVNMTGVVKLNDVSWIVLEGMTFPGAGGTSIGGASDHLRVTRSRYNSGSFHVEGTAHDNRIDHSEFGPKKDLGNLIQPTGLSTNTTIDHNYLHDVSAAGGNGEETIRLGCCGATFDNHPTGNIVEYNLLVGCSGDAEIISMKSSSNTFRYNTIRNSSGNISLRAGKNNLVYGNFVFGTGNQGGIRAYDAGHKIYNNYIATGSALIANRVDAIHAAVVNAVIVHNTFLGSVNLAGMGNTFSNNITSAAATLNSAMAMGNMLAADVGFQMKGELKAIATGSKAIDAAVGSFPFVTDDISGQPRMKPDVGADELSDAPETRRPLTPADVGPNAP